jgi:CelD/BcsL family acetyltransferase involved in cellulose biosynthesis
MLNLERTAALGPLREVWSSLAAETRNVFSTWEWASTWWQHFGGGRDVDVAAIPGHGADPIALLPIYRRRVPFCTILRFIGHGPADELGPVAAPEHRSEAIASLRRLLDMERSAVFVGDRLAEGTAHGLLGAHRIALAPTPVLRFETREWDAYLASRSSNFRQVLRRKERRLLKDGATYRLTDPDSLHRDLDTLFALHRERWEPLRTGFVEHERFHRDFAAVASERGWLRLWILEVGRQPAAAWLGFRFGSVESYYQAGRARRFDSLSPGLVLLAHTVREAQADDIAEYRFLRGDESFKRRFTDDEPAVETVAATRGPLAAAALSLALRARNALPGLSKHLR